MLCCEDEEFTRSYDLPFKRVRMEMESMELLTFSLKGTAFFDDSLAPWQHLPNADITSFTPLHDIHFF